MRKGKEAEEAKELQEVKEKSGAIAAFFDLDGTLIALPSLEQRLFQTLRCQRVIPARNYWLWLREAIRLAPQGIPEIVHANKMYLRGVQSLSEGAQGLGDIAPSHRDGHQAEGQAVRPPRCYPRLPVPTFFPQGVERVAWHARQGHAIVLVTGTLEPLASAAAVALAVRLAVCGLMVPVEVFATRPEELRGRWTGRIVGEPMFGKEKALAAKKITEEMNLNLTRCYAYGDSVNDQWILAAVGRPAAVNPAPALERLARKRGWPILHWSGQKNLAQREQAARASQRGSGGVRGREEKIRIELPVKEQSQLAMKEASLGKL